MSAPPDRLSRIRGCLLGGAVGDALGAPVEFMSTREIEASFGAQGILELASAYGRVGAVTDDTQMTLFTAEGLIRARVCDAERGGCHSPSVIHHALLRWLHTQGGRSAVPIVGEEGWPDGWLVKRAELHSQRAPGMTCLSSLQASTRLGEDARNDSKGCGAVMRVAPIGLVASSEVRPNEDAPPDAFALACESAKSTHGHVSSTLSSGFFPLVVAHSMRGGSLAEAIGSSKAWVERAQGSHEVVAAIQGALALADSDAPSSPRTVEKMGGGWVAEEALAISLFCALRAESFEHGLRLAVNHGGDSDSTGSMTGQLLGTLWGVECIPARWLEQVELRDIIEELAQDLVARTIDYDRYPGR